jgi:hypothetical protein
MPSQHKNPLLGWRPPAKLSAWARAEAERRGVKVGVILTEALEAYRFALDLYEAAAQHDDSSLGVATLRAVLKRQAF